MRRRLHDCVRGCESGPILVWREPGRTGMKKTLEVIPEMKRKTDGGRKRTGGFFLLLFVFLLILPRTGTAETVLTTRKTVTGFFPYRNYVRPTMTQTTDTVDFIPAYTILTLDPVDDTWGTWTSPRGKTGYVNYSKMLPVPSYEREKVQYIYSEKRVKLRSLPYYEAPVVCTAEENELLTRDGSLKGYLHVTVSDGTEGYVLPGGLKEAKFSPGRISSVLICTAEETALLDMPLRGAHAAGAMQPDRLYTAEAAWGKYYALRQDGAAGYVYVLKSRVAVCNARNDLSHAFFSVPRGGPAAEGIFTGGLVRKGGASFRRPNGEEIRLPEGSRLYLYSGFGKWYGAVYDGMAGYLLREETEILNGETMMARIRETDLSGGNVQRNDLLDQAFAMVEEGNPFQARYNLLSGSEIRSLLPLGVPYFWGGRSYSVMVERRPAYAVREAWQSSRVYYQKGTKYLYGFDCIGFVKAVYSLAGTPIEGSVTGHGDEAYCQAGQHIYCDESNPLPEDWTEAARVMQPGDIMVIHHPGTHAMMYMGTLREYGYTEEQLPALAKYLDYPLMLQSGENPYSYLRFGNMIRTTNDRRTSEATPPDGGVGVCILGVPSKDAEMAIECHDTVSRCFDVEGSCVTIMGFGNVRDYFVYRMGAGEEVSASVAADSMDEMEAMEEVPETETAEGIPEEKEEITIIPEEQPADSPEITVTTETDPADAAVTAEEVPEITIITEETPADLPEVQETEEIIPAEIPEIAETTEETPADTAEISVMTEETPVITVTTKEDAEPDPAVIITTRRAPD